MTTHAIPFGIDFPRLFSHAAASLARFFSTPGAAGRRQELADSADTAAVRELAYAYSKTDPGFASDLYAAAARHEGVRAG